MTKKKPLADRIRAEIAARKLTAYRVSKDTGINQTTAARFVRGDGDFTLENTDKVLDYLGATVTFPPAGKRRS